MNCTSFLPEVKLPRVEVDPIIVNPNHADFRACYIPVLSNLEGAMNILIGTATLVATVAYAALCLVSLPLIVPIDIIRSVEIVNGFPVFQQSSFPPISLLAGGAVLVGLQYSAFHLIYGIIESIPVVGNLTLAFWDGRIRVIPN